MTPYQNDHSRLLDNLGRQADAVSTQASKWAELRATAEANVAEAQTAFLADYKPDNARELAEAHAKLRDLTVIVDAVIDAGGPTEARARHLRSSAVYSAFSQGFAERAAAIAKLAPIALKRLGEARSALTETEMPAPLIELNPVVCAWRAHRESITTNLAVAVFGKTYATARGVGHAARTFDDLYAAITQPLPTAPTLWL